jgi:hypothetical protein
VIRFRLKIPGSECSGFFILYLRHRNLINEAFYYGDRFIQFLIVINSNYLYNKDKTQILGLISEQEVKWQPVDTYRRI